MPNDQEFFRMCFCSHGSCLYKQRFAIRELLPAHHHLKMRFYFEDYGCLKCGKKRVLYGSNAMCTACVQSVKLKMLFAVKRRWRTNQPTEPVPRTFKSATQARRLLADLALTSRRSHKRNERD